MLFLFWLSWHTCITSYLMMKMRSIRLPHQVLLRLVIRNFLLSTTWTTILYFSASLINIRYQELLMFANRARRDFRINAISFHLHRFMLLIRETLLKMRMRIMKLWVNSTNYTIKELWKSKFELSQVRTSDMGE